MQESKAKQNDKHINLLDIGIIKGIFKSNLFPMIIRIPVVAVFMLIFYVTLFDTTNVSDNLGTALTWILWWPLLPLAFILFGRLWCGICPLATVSDTMQKFFGANKPVPKFLKKYGIWIIDATFLLITWADHIWGIVENVRMTGYLLLLIMGGAILAGLFYERRTFCKYLCFLGGLSGNYSRAGALELRADSEVCKTCTTHDCYKGNEKAQGCPMFEFPMAMETNANCNLCGNCIKSCPKDNIRISPRIPTKEFWFIKKPKIEESFLAMVIGGIVIVQNITMLPVWQTILTGISHVTRTENYNVNFTVAFLIAMALPVIALWVASLLSGKSHGEKASLNFARFGYAIIPLDFAGHMAHNLFHLFGEGKAVLFTTMRLLGMPMEGSTAILSTPTIQIMQYVLVVLGALGSLYSAYRIGKFNHPNSKKLNSMVMPMYILIIILTIVNFWMFAIPMASRM